MAEAYRSPENKDIVLPPGTYVYLQEKSSGVIRTVVGPASVSITGQDIPVRFNEKTRLFEQCDSDKIVNQNVRADEGSYVVLHSPVDGNVNVHPEGQQKNVPPLQIGRKVVIAGPVQFPLWPGQTATVISGHNLRSNQYLLVRVYNVDEAKKNWSAATVVGNVESTVTPPAGSAPAENKDGKDAKGKDAKDPKDAKGKAAAPAKVRFDPATLTQGKLLVIKGTDVSFYIPPTGIEVIPVGESFVRDALSLEQLEYCILVDENGRKRYERGPQVVFPEPTESFLKDDDSNIKFRAIELSKISGIHVKVITAYEDGDKSYSEGDELFLTGDDQAIYFPRPEHSIIKYGTKQVHHATAIQRGQGRYVMNRSTGEIRTERGYKMLLPNPTNEVLVRRVLSDGECELWYPENQEALAYNKSLRAVKSTVRNVVTDEEYSSAIGGMDYMGSVGSAFEAQNYAARSMVAIAAAAAPPMRSASHAPVGKGLENFERGTSYTEPRTVTFNNKYDGVPVIQVWTGYAVMVVGADGTRKVVVGPSRLLLNYDETLEVLELSTGKPKNTDTILRTAYLRVLNNKVSDILTVETSDHVRLTLKLSFVVDFMGTGKDRDSWFNVSNYVKFMCDHIRSILKGVAKLKTVEEFYSSYVTIIRDTILGTQDKGKRSGMVFDENNMQVKDVEILSIEIEDTNVKTLLSAAQFDTVKNNVDLATARRAVETAKKKEELNRERLDAEAKTAEAQHTLAKEGLRRKAEIAASEFGNELKAIAARFNAEQERQKTTDLVATAELAREKSKSEHTLAVKAREDELARAMLTAEVDAAVKRFEAASENLGDIAISLNNAETLRVLAEASNQLKFIGGNSVADALQKVFSGTPLADKIAAFGVGLATNGATKKIESSVTSRV
jgi:major vault protein